MRDMLLLVANTVNESGCRSANIAAAATAHLNVVTIKCHYRAFTAGDCAGAARYTAL